MPHECTDCGRVFEDGSTEMLSGCPDCGGTTFQFRPDGKESSTDSPDPPETPDPEVDRVTRTVGTAASVVRNLVGDSTPEGEPEFHPDPSDGKPPDTDERPNTDDTPDVGGDHTDPVEGSTDTDEQEGGETTTDEQEGSETTIGEQEGGETTTGEEDGSETTTGESPTDSLPEAGETSAEWPGEDGFRTSADDESAETTAHAEDETRSDAGGDIVEADESSGAAGTEGDRPPVPDPRPLSVRSEESQESTDKADSEDEDATVAAGEDRPSLSELRAELNDQFESIRVRAPGQYELNLMELYDREEYIIALQEDGKYTVQLPERWDER